MQPAESGAEVGGRGTSLKVADVGVLMTIDVFKKSKYADGGVNGVVTPSSRDSDLSPADFGVGNSDGKDGDCGVSGSREGGRETALADLGRSGDGDIVSMYS